VLPAVSDGDGGQKPTQRSETVSSLYTARSSKTYNLFISHAWGYTKGYNRLVELLNEASNFRWKNYSAPRADPAADPKTQVGKQTLVDELKDQIRPVHVVLIMGGMYANHSEWIQREIDIAVDWKKPIIGLRPWGSERTPSAVSNAANEMVGWTTDSIVSAIRRHAA
jgi:hypothetical protein